jgi:DNA-binding transcriptional LysR family regulator
MDTESARTWTAFVEAGCNLSKAGKVVALSQPAVHAKLQSLSRAVGVQLYERRGRGLVLTPAGNHVSAWAKDVIDSERALRAKLHQRDDANQVVLACGEGVFVHVVAERIAAHMRKHPGSVRIVILDGPAAAAAVVRGEADIAVAAGPAAHEPSLRQTPLCTTALVAVVDKRHPLAKLEAIDAGSLFVQALIVPPRGRPLRTTLDDWAAQSSTTVRVAAESTSWEAVARLASLRVGVGLVNDIVLTPKLVRVAIIGAPKTTYRVLVGRERTRDAAAGVLSLLRD